MHELNLFCIRERAQIQPAMKTKALLLPLAFLAVSLIWGSTYFALRVSLESFPPFVGGGARFLTAGAVLYALARVRGEASPSVVEWRSALVSGALFFALGNGLVGSAEKSLSSGLVSVLVATMPLWVALLSRCFGERATRRELIGIGVGLAGVAVMNLGGELRASPIGAAAGLLAPMGWALGSIASKRMQLPKGMAMRTAAQMLMGGATMLLVSAVLGERPSSTPSANALLALGYLAVFGSLIGFSAFSYLLANVRPALATSYAYVNPVIAVAIGVLWAGEKLDLASAFGAVMVIGAVILALRPGTRTASARTAAASVTRVSSPEATPVPISRPLPAAAD